MQRKILSFSFCIFLTVSSAHAQSRQYRTSSFEEMAGNLTNQVRLLQDENAKLAGSVYSLQQEMKELQQRVRNYQSEIEELRKLISAESNARKKQLGMIADKIQQAGERTVSASTEEYDYYVVESGATLSAISRATGISISRLKKVNNMTNDTLRIGQKLKIPRK